MTNNTNEQNRKINKKFNIIDAVLSTLYVAFTTITILGIALENMVLFIVGAILFVVLSLIVFLPNIIKVSIQFNKFKKLTKAFDHKEKKYREYRSIYINDIFLSTCMVLMALIIPVLMVVSYTDRYLFVIYSILMSIWTFNLIVNYFRLKKSARYRKNSLIYAQSSEQTTATDSVDTKEG